MSVTQGLHSTPAAAVARRPLLGSLSYWDWSPSCCFYNRQLLNSHQHLVGQKKKWTGEISRFGTLGRLQQRFATESNGPSEQRSTTANISHFTYGRPAVWGICFCHLFRLRPIVAMQQALPVPQASYSLCCYLRSCRSVSPLTLPTYGEREGKCYLFCLPR